MDGDDVRRGRGEGPDEALHTPDGHAELGAETPTGPADGEDEAAGDVMWDGSHAFVPNLEDGTVSVIDLLNAETDATVEACPGPAGGALTPDQVTYIVACGGSDEVVFINTASRRVVGHLQ